MLIDSHCHLNNKKLAGIGSPSEIVARANAAGIVGMVTICCRVASEFPEILEIARNNKNVWCTVGTHPHDAGEPGEMAVTLDELVRLAKSDPKIVGIGESGLDYFYKHSTPEDQTTSFRKHIRACVETGLPLVVHARDADEDIMKIIREEGTGTNLKGVMHCFSSGRKMGEEAVNFGFHISFSGIVTFDKSDELRAFARDVPADRVLVETDAPYLAPEPFRGKTNEPALTVHTAAVIAKARGMSESDLAALTTKNFFTLFDRAKLA